MKPSGLGDNCPGDFKAHEAYQAFRGVHAGARGCFSGGRGGE